MDNGVKGNTGRSSAVPADYQRRDGGSRYLFIFIGLALGGFASAVGDTAVGKGDGGAPSELAKLKYAQARAAMAPVRPRGRTGADPAGQRFVTLRPHE